MSSLLPFGPPSLYDNVTGQGAGPTDVAAGKAVRSTTWQSVAQIVNYVRAKGAVLVPTVQLETTVNAGASTDFKFRVAPGTLSKAALWVICIRSASATVSNTVNVTVPIGGTTTQTVASPSYDLAGVVVRYDTTITSTIISEFEAGFTIAPTAGGANVVVAHATCYECSREILLQTAPVELGIDVQSEVVGQPIVFSSNRSYGAIAVAALDAKANNGRRAGLGHWQNVNGTNFTTTGFVNGISLPMLGRKMYNGETNRNMSWRVLARYTGSFSAEVRLTSSKTGTTTVVPVPVVGTPTWYPLTSGAPALQLIDSEDLSTSDGLQGGTHDIITVSGRVLTSGTLSIFAFSCFEAYANV